MATVGQRPDIEGKVSQIGDRIVRGKAAKANSAVKWYRINRVATITASALTSIGLTNPLLHLVSDDESKVTLSQVFNSWNGVPKLFSFAGVGIFIVGTIALAFYRQDNVEKKAIQSLGLGEAMDQLESEMRKHLETEEPIEQLLPVYERAYALESTHLQAMPNHDQLKARVEEYTSATIAEYCKWWGSAPPMMERREQ
ncbi:hypothetical protein SAMN05216486_11717 [bacterium JGI 053]|nr:hypothetical protein SAMN05216486_11717 [bacterium JGI 053]